ncbi:hypothetical protein RUND412_010741 [Rhizina undulata]
MLPRQTRLHKRILPYASPSTVTDDLDLLPVRPKKPLYDLRLRTQLLPKLCLLPATPAPASIPFPMDVEIQPQLRF